MTIRALLPIAAAGPLLGAASPAAALLLTPDTLPQWTTSINSALDSGDVEDITGLAGLDLLYKFEVDVGEDSEPPYAGSYEGDVDDASGTIEYVSGPSIVCGVCVLVVKDGNNIPAQYLFNLSAGSPLWWNGTDDIVLAGFWPNQGGISHVGIWGVPGTSVPEPGTLGLLGVGLLVLGGLKRFGRRRA